jgi:GAF domain-containing protein
VLRTKARAVLDDVAADPGSFAGDPYFAHARPRAVLCLPILRQAEVIAVLYLENDLVAGAFTSDRLTALELLASQAAISIDNALLLERERVAKAEARFVADASKALAESLDYDVTVRHLARQAVPSLADWCVVDVFQDGKVRRVAGAHVDPAKESLVLDLEKFPVVAESPPGGAIESARTVVLSDITDATINATHTDPSHAAAVRSLGPRSIISVPLFAHGHMLGAMTFALTRPDWRSGPSQIALAEELARRAAVAIEHADLYKAAQEAICLRDEFLSLASHELRTPLTSLGLSLQSLHRASAGGARPLDPAKVGSALHRALQQQARLTRLVGDLLDVSRIGAGRRRPLAPGADGCGPCVPRLRASSIPRVASLPRVVCLLRWTYERLGDCFLLACRPRPHGVRGGAPRAHRVEARGRNRRVCHGATQPQ